MKKIYFVYECDTHRDYNSFVVKECTTSKKLAKKLYKEGKKEYKDDSYYLNLAVYTPGEGTIDSNLFRELETIKTTEK